MLLQSIKIVDLHGKLNFDLRLNDDINLLVGINGSGKTSVLNAIDWLLTPNLKKLTISKFKELELRFTVKDVPYSVRAAQENDILELSVSSASFEKPIPPITVTLSHSLLRRLSTEAELVDENIRTSHGLEAAIRLEPHELQIWEILKSFPSPTVITLNRTLSAEAGDLSFVEVPNMATTKSEQMRTPIRHVQQVMSVQYSEYRAKTTQHDNELKARILMSALQDPMTAFDQSTFEPMSPDEISRLEIKVIKHLSSGINADEVTKHVRQFFKSSKLLSKRLVEVSDKRDFVEAFMLMQYRQIENLAKAFNDLEVKNAAAYVEIKNYLDAINKFLKDSGKILFFNEKTNRLVFSFLDEYDRTDPQKSPAGEIAKLSSGEQQILILFTFLKFVANSSSVFIIDEPELSLHPKWQHEFMKIFLGLRPKNTQLLLATHSPDIVGNHKASCIPLRQPVHA